MVLEWLKEEDFYEGQIGNILRRKSKKPSLKDLDILKYKTRKNFPFDSLYSHQYKSIKSFLNGNNICLTTGTSSGKTLVYALCINRNFIIDNDSRALIVYPTKALSRDQKDKLNRLFSKINSDLTLGIYDGDSTREEKKEALDSNVVISNFQGLNYYLEHHDNWSEFFSNLQTIVIDEAHSYVGLTGINVSFIIRRIKRLVNDVYSSSPQYILTSATIGNPEEHCYNLTGERFDIFKNDFSGKSEKIITLWNPSSYENESGELKRKSSHKEVSKILSSCAENKDMNSLVFVKSRKLTEIVAKNAEEICDYDVNIEPYNAGHTKKERRNVEKKLKNGDLDAVVSTNALELGIDVGEIDCVIIDGYPGNRNSFWQQIGRSGRDNSRSYVFFVAKNTTLDQYIMRNPDYLFEKEMEDCVIDLDNKHIMKNHILCACSEDPIRKKDWKYFDKKNLEDNISELRKMDYITGNYLKGIEYIEEKMPQKYIDIYSIGNNNFEVRIIDDEGEIKRTLPDIDKERAFREFHPGSIYIHKGIKYKVVNFSEKYKYVELKEHNCDYTTTSSKDVNIKSIEKKDSKNLNGIKIYKGSGTIQQRYNSYSKIKENGERKTGFDTNLDSYINIETQLMWFEFKEKHLPYKQNKSNLGSLHAMEHSLIKLSPALIKLDSNDIGGLSTLKSSESKCPTIFIYDGIDGGIGFSWKIYQKIKILSEKTKKNIDNCKCNYRSCPACTISSNCGDDNEPLDPKGASYILDKI